ncbi:MAG: ABC transporter substrate-binding protein [Rhodomicrobium sp.]
MRRCIVLIILLCSACLLAPNAYAPNKLRRVGILMSVANDQEGSARAQVFQVKLQELGWIEGQNIEYAICWADGDASRAEACAASLVDYRPDLIFTNGPESLTAIRHRTATIPVVFTQIGEPVQSGLVASLARPGGNITGSVSFEYTIAGKWVELLKQVAPGMQRLGVLQSPTAFTHPGYLRAIEEAAHLLGMSVVPASASTADGVRVAIETFSHTVDGMIVLPSTAATMNRTFIAALALSRGLPAIYAYRLFPASGGLISYGSSVTEIARQSAAQADRILRGTRAGDLPVQLAPKFELVINLKTAKALGLTVPPELLIRADELIE